MAKYAFRRDDVIKMRRKKRLLKTRFAELIFIVG